MDTKFNLYLIRHGETYLNRYKKMQGWADSPLTEEGKAIAIETGMKLADVPFARVYTSDSGRTVETAEMILQQNHYSKNLSINRRKAFRESFFGSFEGEYSEVTFRKVAQDNGCSNSSELFQKHTLEEVMNFIKQSDPFRHAENYHELWERIDKGLNEIVSSNEHNHENILLVTHGVIIRHIISKFSTEFENTMEIKNSSVSVIEYFNNNYKVISFNQ
ncbi:histidine phosphatase family protein [Neobacillus cucumis]|uniref:Histidine phosphatase family protein n=1 Tax=Neobacillus cucumis TaxID=1740721 RepID=A0A2N5HBD5_9BACI|nr:histidine phosphatase family protein [Neobacillus cucumis]PLS02836.1 histidine phosphatase family protein [Neobacillus cucumis]